MNSSLVPQFRMSPTSVTLFYAIKSATSVQQSVLRRVVHVHSGSSAEMEWKPQNVVVQHRMAYIELRKHFFLLFVIEGKNGGPNAKTFIIIANAYKI